MAINVVMVKDSEDYWGKHHIASWDITLDSSYPTGGETITPSQFMLKQVRGMIFVGGDADSAGYVPFYNTVTKKLMMFRSAGFTPAGTNSQPSFTVQSSGAIGANMEVGLSADSAAATFEGGTGITAARTLTTTSPVGVPTFTGTAVAAAALAQVADTTNLSALTLRAIVIGV